MYVVVWEFVVRPEKVDAFVAAYQSEGAWAQLFAQAEGYLGTELLSAMDRDRIQYVTIDRWKAAEDFRRFQERFGTEYRRLDTQLEGLTIGERQLGTFVSEN